MTIRVGEFPVISLMLAFSFGIYGLLKKIVKIEAISSIALECIVTAPAGLIYMIYLWNTGTSSVGFEYGHILVDVLRCSNCHSINLILSRCQTYSVISNRIHSIRWSTIMFFLGIFAFKEHFDAKQLVTFALIWIGIVLYSISQYVKMKRNPRPE